MTQSLVQQFQNLQLIVTPDKTHDFLMTTAEVAKGYGVSESSILSHKHRQKDEILENIHFISVIAICNDRSGMKLKKLFWTRRGVIRLGMFIKSQRAIKFRDWAENLIINEVEKPVPVTLPSPSYQSLGNGLYYRHDPANHKFYSYRLSEVAITNAIISKISKLAAVLEAKKWRGNMPNFEVKNETTGETLYHPQAIERTCLLFDLDYLLGIGN